MMMRKLSRAMAIAAGLALAAQAYAGDAEDTRTEKKAQMKKAARDVKGATVGKSAGDHVDDATDTAKEHTAKAKKAGRKAAHRFDKKAHDVTK